MPALEAVRRTRLALVAPRPIVENAGLVLHDLPFEFPEPETALYWHREYAGDPALSWLRGVIGDVTRPSPAPVSA